uniref:Uncharacterized protein n=1 Tax=Sphaerodactylus townsendi TaxID=933632 RepID=A0ACB8G7Q9_9SAUR
MVLTIVLLVLSLGAAFWCWRINSEKSAQAATIPTVQVEESPSDDPNAEVAKRSPPEGNDKSPSYVLLQWSPFGQKERRPGSPNCSLQRPSGIVWL